jgi:hypothetical protein
MYGCKVSSMLPELGGKDGVSILLSYLHLWLDLLRYCKTCMMYNKQQEWAPQVNFLIVALENICKEYLYLA